VAIKKDTKFAPNIPGLRVLREETLALLHRYRPCRFVNVAFAVPGLEDNGMGRSGHVYCRRNLAGGSGSDTHAVNVDPHKGDGISCRRACRQAYAGAGDGAAGGRRDLDRAGRSRPGAAHEELVHVRSGICGAGEICGGPQGFQHGAQHAGMMVRCHGFVTGFDLWADHRHDYMSAAASQHRSAAPIVSAQIGFVRPDDEHAVAAWLEGRGGEQWPDVALQPLVGRPETRTQVSTAIVHVMVTIWRDESEIGQGAIGNVGSHLDCGVVVLDQAAIGHVSEIGQRRVALHVRVVVEPGVARVWQSLRVGLKRHAIGQQVALNVVHVEDRGGAVVVGDFLAGSYPEVIFQRTVLVGVKLRGQSALIDQAVQVGHRGAAYDVFVAAVFFRHNVHVFRAGNLSERGHADQQRQRHGHLSCDGCEFCSVHHAQHYEGIWFGKKSVRTLSGGESLTRHKPSRVAGFRGY